MKYLKSMLLFVLVFFSMAYTTRDADAPEKIILGSIAPEIHLQHLSFKGKYSLVQFWAAYDAHSRMNNLLLSNKIAKMQREDVQMISISFDENRSVFEETIKTDQLDPSSQFNIPASKHADILRNYHLGKGFRNLLISPDGIIIAVNVSPEDLMRIL